MAFENQIVQSTCDYYLGGMSFDLHPSRWVALLAAFCLFFIVLSGTVRYMGGDSRYCLLASQALIEHGSLRLDPYSERFSLSDENNGKLWQIFKDPETHHVYYDYPVGTSIFSVPFVAVGLQLGFLPIKKYDDAHLQMIIAAVLLVITFLLLYRLALLYLGDWEALAFSALFILGSSLISTLATSLWSQNFEVIFILLALTELAEARKGIRTQPRGWWLGLLLFSAYLCRPTAAPLILVVFAYLALRHRKALIATAGVAGGLLAAFILWSELELGRALPRYYSPDNWPPYGEYFRNMWPVLLGPSRGLFSFTPVLALGLAGFAVQKLRREALFWAMWAWLVILTMVVLRSKNPWGGWCYGPRFFTEILPGMALALLMVAESAMEWRPRWRNALGVAFLVGSLFGLYVHTWQGLYNQATASWNGSPNIDETWPAYRWDWRYPQFMATHRQNDLRLHESKLAGLVSGRLQLVPENGTLLCGYPNPDHSAYFNYWNKHDLLHTGKMVYNTILDIEEAGAREFWFAKDVLPIVQNRQGWQIIQLPQDTVLGPDSIMTALPQPQLGHARAISTSN